jgi:dihydrofolate reductase
MRKIIVLSFISLDGVMQAPGGPDEDPSSSFTYGGWSFPYSDETSGNEMVKQISAKKYDMLLGRKTYDIFAPFWPKQDSTTNPIAKALNDSVKYVASRSPLVHDWSVTKRLEGDVVQAIKNLKSESGNDLQVHGSGNLIQTLLKNDLVDELWLKIHPVTLGPGKRLFAEGAIPAAFTLTDHKVTPKGVIFANYTRAGDVKTGSFV